MEVSQVYRNSPVDEGQNQLPLSPSELKQYKSTYEQLSAQKKQQYLQAIKSHNKTLVNKIKELDKRVNAEMESLNKKILVSSKKTAMPKLEELETHDLTAKFQQLRKVKKELELKKTGTDSLQFMVMVKQQHQIKDAALTQKIATIKTQIASLEKIKQKKNAQENTLKKQLLKMGQFNMYGDQIEQLRKKVHQKSQQIKTKKEQFFSLYQKNRSNKSVVVDKLPSHQSNPDPQLLQLKQQYLLRGKIIEQLKIKRSRILKGIPEAGELKKALEKLKVKYETLQRLGK